MVVGTKQARVIAVLVAMVVTTAVLLISAQAKAAPLPDPNFTGVYNAWSVTSGEDHTVWLPPLSLANPHWQFVDSGGAVTSGIFDWQSDADPAGDTHLAHLTGVIGNNDDPTGLQFTLNVT